MDAVTVHHLNAINRDFYRTTANDFDMLRRGAWPGWKHLLPYLASRTAPLSVLDIGCGNGRFGLFLASKLTIPIDYFGIDNNAALLQRARETLQGLTVRLEDRDILESLADVGQFDLVAMFGVLHHVPGADRRLELMRTLADHVAPGGLLAFACWRFNEYERYTSRFSPAPDHLNLEHNDYLLDWRRGKSALRYCHYVDDAEHDALVAASDLQELERFRADGETGDVNCYSLLRKP